MTLTDIHTHKKENGSTASIYSSGIAYTDDRIISLGIHPWDIDEKWPDVFAKIKEHASRENVAAIGECGIDLIKSTATEERQKEVFKAHALLAEELGKPLIIHCVKAFDAIIAAKKECKPSVSWIIHGFRGKPQQALQLLGAGFHISLGEHFNRETAMAIPAERLFIESDESAMPIYRIYESIARARGISTEELALQIKSNKGIFKQF